jgi:hypothetical protein
MNRHVEVITKIPQNIFDQALEEVTKIDWNNLPIRDRRRETSDGNTGQKHVFSTSTTLHLRYHDIKPGMPLTIEAHSAIVECKDTFARLLYPKIDNLVEWICDYVKSTRLGRIMIVKLDPMGDIPLHIDPGEYFTSHYRFHVPFITNDKMMFINEDKEKIHMPLGHLCQLNNRKLHGAMNQSEFDRIHMIIDIDTKENDYAI